MTSEELIKTKRRVIEASKIEEQLVRLREEFSRIRDTRSIAVQLAWNDVAHVRYGAVDPKILENRLDLPGGFVKELHQLVANKILEHITVQIKELEHKLAEI